MNRILALLLILISCSPKVVPTNPEELKPAWLKAQPYQDGYYTGIGHSVKVNNDSNNYIQTAKKNALEDLVSEIKVNVSSTSILSQLEADNKIKEKYEQTIKTTAVDEIEEFEMVDAWEDANNYWVYYRLSIARYHQIKEEQKRNATLLATDYFKKGKQAEVNGERLQALSFYFQALRSLEKYLGDAILVSIDGREILLVNEVYAAIQFVLDRVALRIDPSFVVLNRRLNQNSQTVIAKMFYKDIVKPAVQFPLSASFEKGAGEVFPDYKINAQGNAKIFINKINSREFEQTVVVKVNIDAICGTSSSPIYALIVKSLNVPSAQVVLQVKRPVVYMTADEKSFGSTKNNFQISNKLKNLLATAGFEFSVDKQNADLWFDVTADAERGSIAGSIYIAFLTSIIKVTEVKEGREVYSTTLDRIKGYGLDYDRSSIDAYNHALDILEKEKVNELMNAVLQ